MWRRARLVETFMPLIASVARVYRDSPSVDRTELLQEGVVGLLRALERYDPQRGVPFWGYAGLWVRQAMQQLVAELTRPLVLSDRALRQLARIKDAHGRALQETGREPGNEELATRSIEEPISSQDGGVGVFGDLLVDPLAEGEYERVLEAVEVEQLLALLSVLSARERDRPPALRAGRCRAEPARDRRVDGAQCRAGAPDRGARVGQARRCRRRALNSGRGVAALGIALAAAALPARLDDVSLGGSDPGANAVAPVTQSSTAHARPAWLRGSARFAAARPPRARAMTLTRGQQRRERRGGGLDVGKRGGLEDALEIEHPRAEQVERVVPDDREARHARLARPRGGLSERLALQTRLVQAALAD